jgi:Helix-turn-helix domain
MSSNPIDLDDLVRQEQAAEILRVRPSTLESWRSTGKGPAYFKVGKTVLYSKNTLLLYLTNTPTVPSPARDRRLVRTS